MEEGEGWGGGGAVEGVNHVVADAAGGFDGGEFGVVDHGLHSGGAASAPGGRDHFLDEIQLDFSSVFRTMVASRRQVGF